MQGCIKRVCTKFRKDAKPQTHTQPLPYKLLDLSCRLIFRDVAKI